MRNQQSADYPLERQTYISVALVDLKFCLVALFLIEKTCLIFILMSHTSLPWYVLVRGTTRRWFDSSPPRQAACMHVSLCTTALCCTRTVSLRRTRTVSLTVLRADKLRGMKKLHAAIISIFISIFPVEAQPQYQYLQYAPQGRSDRTLNA